MRTSIVLASGLLLAMAATAAGGARWKKEMDFYKSIGQPPMATLALGSVDVRLGTRLERLTLLSGEGHTGKKIAGGIMAVALGAMGASGVDTASREPLEDHFTQDDAAKIAAEVAESVAKHLAIPGVKVIAGADVTGTAAYAAAKDGQTAATKTAYSQKDGRFSREYTIGYWMQPAGAYAYRGEKGGLATRMGLAGLSGMYGDSDFSPKIRAAVGADTLARVDVFLFNDRSKFGIRELKVRLFGNARNPANDKMLVSYVLDDANAVAVPVGADHKANYAHWQALRPQFEAKLDELGATLAPLVR